MQVYSEKMKTVKKIILLSAVLLSGFFFWVLWSSQTLEYTFSKAKVQEADHIKNAIPMLFGYGEKRAKNTNNVSIGVTEYSVIELPGNLNSVNLKAWELMPEEGEEHLFVGNEADYLQGERSTPTLTFKNRKFFLNNMQFRILSGAIHYFRVLPEYWMDRLKKLKACGLNTVETYVAWNLHEPSPGKFDFEGILNLRKFIITASELGLYVILRPGPYICSEFEYGGLPGWLLADPNMRVRTNYRGYIDRVNIYFSKLLPQVLDLQFGEGGPIIMFQVENEYLSYAADKHHVQLLYYMMRKYGVKEMVVTSDHTFDVARAEEKFDMSKYALPTINTDWKVRDQFDYVKSLNPHFPIMVMEFWCGWFDTWRSRHHNTVDMDNIKEFLTRLVDQKASFNFYMFIGGTNFGFTNGANQGDPVHPITTSYDYDAPLTESGDTTPKYFFLRDQLLKFYKSIDIPYLPDVPPNLPKANYGSLKMKEIMDWTSLLSLVPMQFQDKSLDFMERYQDRAGRHFTLGYVVYSHLLRPWKTWHRQQGQHFIGYVSGRLSAILSGETFYVGSDSGSVQEDDFLWDKRMETRHLYTWAEYGMEYDDIMQEARWIFAFGMKAKLVAQDMNGQDKTKNQQLDLLVENQGRVNYYSMEEPKINKQYTGLKGQVLKQVFGIEDEEWSVKFLTFDKEQCQSFSTSSAWMTMKAYGRHLEDTEQKRKIAPALYRTYLDIAGRPEDTFVKLDGWTKGIVIVNGFNLGRYWKVGPQRTLYLPAPLLKKGINEIMVFEEMSRGEVITFQDTHILG